MVKLDSSGIPLVVPKSETGTVRLREFEEQGYSVIPDMADEKLLQQTRACVQRAVAAETEEHLAKTKSPGTLIDSDAFPELADLIGNPKALHELGQMGWEDIKFWKAVIISKPPGGPRLYWHQDCMTWDDPRSYSNVAPMVFLMYYMEDTSRHNGCLRLIPKSHRQRISLHDTGVAHDPEINRIDNPEDLRFADFPGEIDVPLRAGDLVIGDARMFHAAHSNNSSDPRTVITIWFYPFFTNLQEAVQSYYHNSMHAKHENWDNESLAKINSLIPQYAGAVTPMEVNRTADARLK